MLDKLFFWREDDELDTSEEIQIHMLTPARRADEYDTKECNVCEIEDEIYALDEVFTGPKGDLQLVNKGCPIPLPYSKYLNNGEDPSIELMEREFKTGFYEKISTIPTEPLSGIGWGSLRKIPAWIPMLLFLLLFLFM